MPAPSPGTVCAAGLEICLPAVDHAQVSVAVLPQAAPTLHVLPAGVRRRLGRGDAVLVLVLAGELLAGMGARVAWDHRDELGQVWMPAAAPVSAESTVTSTSTMTTTSWVVVPPAPVPTDAAPPPPPPRTTARNPFQAQVVG